MTRDEKIEEAFSMLALLRDTIISRLPSNSTRDVLLRRHDDASESLRTALSRASESGGNPTAWGIENARGAMEPCHFYLSEADARYYISYLNEWGSIGEDRPYRIIPLYRGLTTCGKPLVPNA